MQFLASRLRLWELSVFVQFPPFELFVENSNSCMRAIWLFFLVDRKWIFYETELKKNIEVWHSFGKWPHLHKLTFCVSVLLLIIKSSQLAREKRFRYCKIRNYRYTKVGLNWLLKSLNASLTSTVNMAFVRRLISIPPPPLPPPLPNKHKFSKHGAPSHLEKCLLPFSPWLDWGDSHDVRTCFRVVGER